MKFTLHLFAIALIFLTACAAMPGATPASTTAASPTSIPLISPESNQSDLDLFIANWLKQNKASSVAIGVIRDGKLTLATGYGLADRELNLPASPDTVYLMASTSKVIVGLAAMKLVEDGLLDLDADIDEYLDFSVRNPYFPEAPLTMRYLLTHTAGLVDAGPDDPADYPYPDPDQSLTDYIQATLLPDGEMFDDGAFWSDQDAPGDVHDYANIGTTLAGLVIEYAADEPFNEFCNGFLFEPLALSHTRWLVRELPETATLAMPYDLGFNPYGIYSFNEYPSGSLRSSVNDYARILQMLIGRGELDGHRILSPESVSEFERVQFPEVENEMGLHIFTAPNADGILQHSHTGGEAGAASYVVYGDDGAGALFITNAEIEEDENYETLMTRLLEEARR